MYIGEISRLTDASPKAIRHYESLGLLGRVTRVGSYRVYSDNEVRQIRLIRQAQALGFRLSELRSVLHGDSSEPDWTGLAQQIDSKRVDIQSEIRRLRRLDAHLDQVGKEIRSCLKGDARSSQSDAYCDPLFHGATKR